MRPAEICRLGAERREEAYPVVKRAAECLVDLNGVLQRVKRAAGSGG